ncbi:DNA polymerase Y family protein [Chryseolinea sp. T2]|uniref:Y-family DNA polymerase n=1 Tax=Chryseolinea sp. T2 TaxID=3129255 RepID=UPI003076D5C6
MGARYISVWFPHLRTDWFALGDPTFHNRPFVLRTTDHGRMVISATNIHAERKGIHKGLVLADARAIVTDLEAIDDIPDISVRILTELAQWCVRFTPVAAVDPDDGLLLEVSGCAHLWGGEQCYMHAIESRLNARGYGVRLGMADTPIVAWAVARFETETLRVETHQLRNILMTLPPEALRIETDAIQRLHKLGLHRIAQFINMPRNVLRRRFGRTLLDQLDKALGDQVDVIVPVVLPSQYIERLPCLEPVATRAGIEFALEELLVALCGKLQREQKGLRQAVFKGYRVDGVTIETKIGTHRPTHHVAHVRKLFENKISQLEPGLGIELFELEAKDIEDNPVEQERIWEKSSGLDDERLNELVDRLLDRGGIEVSRFVAAEHYWPERSFKKSVDVSESPAISWRTDVLRPSHLLSPPELIDVTAPIPDYPPMLFVYEGKIHRVVKADGPERIEQEWWLQQGQHRDYYILEDENGVRYWIFRLGHYHDSNYKWFIHGFFA